MHRNKGFGRGGSNTSRIPIGHFGSKYRRQAREPVDYWLDSIGLYRKRVARDASCVFRVVAEQVFSNQVHHPLVRQACIRYLERSPEVFRELLNAQGITLSEHLEKMRSPETFAGPVEIYAVALLYRHDVLVYRSREEGPIRCTGYGFKEVIRLSDGGGNHYDSVCQKEKLTNAGVAQAIAYEMLYKEVFQMGDLVNVFVRVMLQPDSNRFFTSHHQQHSKSLTDSTAAKTTDPDPNSKESVVVKLLQSVGAPFPYKIAKSCLPHIYRNVDFDVWIEERKRVVRMEKGDMYGAAIVPGNRCRIAFRDDPEKKPTVYKLLDGIIQAIIIPEKPDMISVFIYAWGERHEVPSDWVLGLKDPQDFSSETLRDLIKEGLPPPVVDERAAASRFEREHASPQQRQANRHPTDQQPPAQPRLPPPNGLRGPRNVQRKPQLTGNFGNRYGSGHGTRTFVPPLQRPIPAAQMVPATLMNNGSNAPMLSNGPNVPMLSIGSTSVVPQYRLNISSLPMGSLPHQSGSGIVPVVESIFCDTSTVPIGYLVLYPGSGYVPAVASNQENSAWNANASLSGIAQFATGRPGLAGHWPASFVDEHGTVIFPQVWNQPPNFSPPNANFYTYGNF